MSLTPATRTPETLLARYRRAKARRQSWEGLWRDCYDYALPQRDGALEARPPGERKTGRIFDGTAPDSVEQLAASLLAELTPPWSRWLSLVPGPKVAEEERETLASALQPIEEALQSHFDRSNFAVEVHQCFLDLVTVGTASLLFEEAPLGEPSAFRFTAVPLGDAVLEEGATGRLDTTFRAARLTRDTLVARFPGAGLPDDPAGQEGEARYEVIEAVLPARTGGYDYTALLTSLAPGATAGPVTLAEGRFAQSPFINFRWMKAPGEIYGRSPVMKALPDIKTANKVMELILKNASIAVTGIWQADDDGVLNPASVKLVPGAIIPKAVGSSGLQPLQPAAEFQLSESLLADLRHRLRHALLSDQLGQIENPAMTATEVLERSAQMTRLLGATYGRLLSELLTPLIARGLAILRRRGEVPDIAADGRLVQLRHRSPLAQIQAQKDVQNTLLWLDQLSRLGPAGLAIARLDKAARWAGEVLGVPPEILRPPEEAEALIARLSQLPPDTAA